MKDISGLQHDNFVHILSFLRAADLAAVRLANKSVFSADRVSEAIDLLGKDVYNLPTSSPVKKSMGLSGVVLKKPDYLYNKELLCLATALCSQPLIDSRGYYVGALWLSSAKKFVEQLQKNMSEFESRRTSTKKGSKSQRRRDVECIAPVSSMTADITCAHGALALSSSGARARRRMVTTRMWHFLRRFYPDGPSFKCSLTSECSMCMNISAELSGNASAEKAQLQFERKMAMVPSVLEPVFARKSGVPMHCVTSRVVFYSGMAAQDGGEDVVTRDEVSAQRGVDTSTQQVHLPSGDLEQPLVPGLYNLVPRAWLRDWRSYVKDVEAPRLLSHLNCAALVCQAHRQLVVPPHLEEYLLGLRASLLGALGLYPGEVVEVLSAEEWDALQDVFRDAGDFSARFCLDGSGAVYWSTGVCTMCDPLSYTPLLGRSEKKKNSARSVNREDGTALDMLY